MNVGDTIKIRLLAAEVRATILEVEKYKGAYILRYRFEDGKEACCTVFPELQSLPPSSFFTESMYAIQGWLEWGEHIWPVPIKKGERLLVGVDQQAMMRRRVDLILGFAKRWEDGGGGHVQVMPGNDWEYEKWKKLGENRGGG